MSLLEISQDNRYLSLYRGFLRISEEQNTVADVPLDGIESVIVTGHKVSYSNNILVEFAERNIPLVICGKNYSPIGMFLALEGNCRQAGVMEAQAGATLPLTKNLWKIVITEKIKNQARVLDLAGIKHNLAAYYENVKSGDSDNYEGIAARIYFPLLFGEGFYRNHTGEGVNAFLNYGYAVIRSAISRYVVAAGLLPSFGIHHKNKLNAFCLVDDIMEPYRPLVDREVYDIYKPAFQEARELNPEYKRRLAAILDKDVKTKECISPVSICMQKSVWSLVDSYKSGKPKIYFEKVLG